MATTTSDKGQKKIKTYIDMNKWLIYILEIKFFSFRTKLKYINLMTFYFRNSKLIWFCYWCQWFRTPLSVRTQSLDYKRLLIVTFVLQSQSPKTFFSTEIYLIISISQKSSREYSTRLSVCSLNFMSWQWCIDTP